MSRGPTRRVRRLIRAGVVNGELLSAADHEADLLAHPYIDLQHVELARLRLAGLDRERQKLLARTPPGVARTRWRPLGRGSALRPRGLAQTRAAQLRAWMKDARKSNQLDQDR